MHWKMGIALVLATVLAVLALFAAHERETSVSMPHDTDPHQGSEPTLRGGRPAANSKGELSVSPPSSDGDPQVFGIRGHVEGANGQPMVALTVTLFSAHALAEDDTDAQGRFLVRTDRRQPGRLVVAAEGHLPYVGPWIRPEPGMELDVKTIRLAPGHVIAGRVVDPKGLPVAGALVIAASDDDPPPPDWLFLQYYDGAYDTSHQTNEDGRFRFDQLPAGKFRLQVDAPEFKEVVLEGVAAGREELRVQLDPDEARSERADEIELRLHLRQPAGREFPACTVGIVDRTRIYDYVPLPQGSDGRVDFKARLVAPLRAEITVADSAYAPAFLVGLHPRPEPYDVELRVGRTISGRVRDDRGEPARCTVDAVGWLGVDGVVRRHASGSTGDETWTLGWTAETDPEGRFTLQGLPPGTVELRVSSWSGGRTEQTWEIETGRSGVVLELQTGLEIAAVLEAPEGAQLASVIVELYALHDGARVLHRERADARRGDRHVFTALAPGDYIVGAISRGARRLGPAYSPPVRPGGRVVRLLLPAHPSTRGIVVDEHGKGVPRAWIVIRQAPELGRRVLFQPLLRGTPPFPGVDDPPSAVSDMEGRFEIPGLPPGSYVAIVGTDGHALAGGAPHFRPGDDLRIQVQQDRRIRGRLDPASDKELAQGLYDFDVEAWPIAGQPGCVLRCDVESSGFFELTHLPPGRFRLVARPGGVFERTQAHNAYAISEIIESGTRGHTLRLKKGKRLRVHVLDHRGRTVTGATVRAFDAGLDVRLESGVGGFYEAYGMPDRPYTVEAKTQDGRRATIRVRPGTPALLRLPAP